MSKTSKARRQADPASASYVIEESPFFQMNRAISTYTLLMDRALRRVGADVPSWRILVLAEMRGPISVSALADMAVVRLSTVTKVVQRLTRRGLIRVRTSKRDARVTEVLITREGRALARTVRDAASRMFRSAFINVSDADLAKLGSLLRQLQANLSKIHVI